MLYKPEQLLSGSWCISVWFSVWFLVPLGELVTKNLPLRNFGCDAAVKSPVEITVGTHGTTCFAHGIFRFEAAE